MRNIMKKMFFLLMAVSMISVGPIGQMSHSFAEETTNVHIYKVQAKDGQKGLPFDGTGTKITNGKPLGMGDTVIGVAGAKFKIYTLKDKDQYDKVIAAKDNDVNLKAALGSASSTETDFTDSNGEVVKSLPNGYYFVEESVTPATYKSGIATSFGLILPAYVNGSITKDLYVSPKNVLEIPFNPTTPEGGTPGLKKELVENGKTAMSKSVSVGEEETWKITGIVPNSVKSLEKLVFLDRISKYLDVVDNSLNVTAGNTPLVTNGVVTEGYFNKAEITKGTDTKNASADQYLLNVDFSSEGIKKLNAGEKIVITFKTKVNDQAIMGRNIYNGVKVIYSNNPGHDFSTEIPGNPDIPPIVPTNPENPDNPDNPNKPNNPPVDPDIPPTNPDEPKNPHTPFVNTGGKKFAKVDATKEDTKLPNAKFYIVKKEGEHIVYYSNTDGNTPKWIDTEVALSEKTTTEAMINAIKTKEKEAAPYSMTSAEETGAFEIKGIPYGKYYLVEAEAPKDYAAPTNPAEFEINSTSYYSNPYDKGQPTAVEPNGENGGNIKNTKYTIPQTGGMGTIILTAIGVVLIAGAYIVYKKNNFIEE